MVSCDDDGPVIDPGTDGINVGDGYYLAKSGEDPSSSAGLDADEVVEAPDFGSQERSGYAGGYMYLEAGDYTLVNIVDKEVTATIGGAASVITDEGSACDFNDYTLVSTEADGSAFSVEANGLYRVTYDEMTNEIVYYEVAAPGLIGNATPGGWSMDTPMDGSVNAQGGSWSVSDVIMRSGAWKIRMNCRWTIDRRIDPGAALPFEPSNGYQLFTNFGGSANDLSTGGSDIPQTEDGIYTVTVDWNPISGFSLTQTKTGEAPELGFNPNDFSWGVIGDATANSWDADRDLLHKFDEGTSTHNWYGVPTFQDEGTWKVRINDDWNLDLGGAIAADGVTTEMVPAGDNLVSPGAGAYYLVISTSDEGATWNMNLSQLGWSVIGNGNPSGDWDNDTDMVSAGFADGISSHTLTGEFSTGEWKFRAGHDWPLNLGTDLSSLILDGGNLTLPEAGNYTITLNFDGSLYSATAVLN